MQAELTLAVTKPPVPVLSIIQGYKSDVLRMLNVIILTATTTTTTTTSNNMSCLPGVASSVLIMFSQRALQS